MTLKRIYPTRAEAQAAADAAWGRRQSQAHDLRLSLALGQAKILA